MRMRAPSLQHAANHDRPLLAWVFCKGSDLLVCRLEHQTDDDYVVVLTTPTRRLFALREAVTGAAEAFQRHASIARELRESGWTLVGYREPNRPEPAARAIARAA